MLFKSKKVSAKNQLDPTKNENQKAMCTKAFNYYYFYIRRKQINCKFVLVVLHLLIQESM